MEVELAFFCDAATVDAHGKVNALGIFNCIHCRKFPACHPRLVTVIQVKAHRSEAGPHKMQADLVDPDGHAVVDPLMMDFSTERGGGARLIAEINGVTFQGAGEHALDIAIDGRHCKSLPLQVTELPPDT